jgi:hypothetical protein
VVKWPLIGWDEDKSSRPVAHLSPSNAGGQGDT